MLCSDDPMFLVVLTTRAVIHERVAETQANSRACNDAEPRQCRRLARPAGQPVRHPAHPCVSAGSPRAPGMGGSPRNSRAGIEAVHPRGTEGTEALGSPPGARGTAQPARPKKISVRSVPLWCNAREGCGFRNRGRTVAPPRTSATHPATGKPWLTAPSASDCRQI
jgi:hypothetical protein